MLSYLKALLLPCKTCQLDVTQDWQALACQCGLCSCACAGHFTGIGGALVLSLLVLHAERKCKPKHAWDSLIAQ